MENDLVIWRELEAVFLKKFPNSVRASIDNMETSRVQFNNAIFEIHPVQEWGFTGIIVWGPAHVPTKHQTNTLPMPLQMFPSRS